MDAQGLPIVSPKIDYGDVEKISPQRLVCFLNHFTAHTVAFLNAFAASCERRLEEVNWRIQRTEATLSVLEAKLSSIPGLDHISAPATTVNTSTQSGVDTTVETTTTSNQLSTELIDNHAMNDACLDENSKAPITSADSHSLATDGNSPPSPSMVRAKDHPSYAKYFRMLHMGVPLQAVLHKCRVENPNLNADVLETPDLMLPVANDDDNDDDDDEGWSQ